MDFYESTLKELHSLPGVRSVGASSFLPVSGQGLIMPPLGGQFEAETHLHTRRMRIELDNFAKRPIGKFCPGVAEIV